MRTLNHFNLYNIMEFRKLESVKIEVETLIPLESDIDRSLICLICQEILKLPVECNYCKNNFCKKCIEYQEHRYMNTNKTVLKLPNELTEMKAK